MSADPFINSLTSFVVTNSRRPITERLNWLLLSNGAADLNDNIIFFGFEGQRKEPSFVAKVPRLPANSWIVQTEYERLLEIWNLLGDDAPLYLPEPIALFDVGRQRVLVISYIQGDGLLFSAKKKLWHDPAQVMKLSLQVAPALRMLHDKAARKLEAGEQVPNDFLKKLEIFNEIFPLSEKEKKILAEMAEGFAKQTGTHKTLTHGDIWHGNIIRGQTQGSLIFVDWQFSRWSRDVNLDVYMFLLAGALTLSHGSPQERARLTAKALMDWRREIIPAYLNAYGRADQFSLLPARYGMLVCCVEKAVRAVHDFGYNQVDGLLWRNLLTELINLPDNGFYDGI